LTTPVSLSTCGSPSPIIAIAETGVADPAPVGHREFEHIPADPALELLGRSGGDDEAVVDDHDLVGQLVGLIQVLGREQQRRARRRPGTG